jgi:threonine/homoserine/homoserine lactone efflux protein
MGGGAPRGRTTLPLNPIPDDSPGAPTCPETGRYLTLTLDDGRFRLQLNNLGHSSASIIGTVLFALLAFAGAAFLIVLLPGPDTLVVMRSLLRFGRANAVRTVIGILTGLSIWILAAALGLSALLRASDDGYLALRCAGAAYLVWMGVQALRARAIEPGASAEPDEPDEPHEPAPTARRRGLLGGGFTAGIATDLLNPKVGVFFIAFLPGFVPHGYDVGLFTILLGAIFVVETAIYFAVFLLASRVITRWLRTPRIQRRVDRATGLVFIGFGARLVLES